MCLHKSMIILYIWFWNLLLFKNNVSQVLSFTPQGPSKIWGMSSHFPAVKTGSEKLAPLLRFIGIVQEEMDVWRQSTLSQQGCYVSV